ncbi:phospholipase D family protein [Propioniciclava sp. MC1595]|uniref:phospholipase D family protein n=1 Tax=Propioniciclava sp. MC1595 TaxID=2760308 RepID=UPI001AA155A0|nr:phospholipase D family protein [Propioniciclava sp. MC1595]QTE26504.1 phospholipase D family protein [Propioniciclava sp. MC1595]
MGVDWLSGEELHRRVITEGVLRAERSVWIATANLKDMYVAGPRRRYRPVLEEFARMAARGVQFRVIHAEVPSRAFRESFDALPGLVEGGLELQICPRSHWKMVIVDGRLGYTGSANFTGAGLGAKSEARRNLEFGAVGDDPAFVARLEEEFDRFWMGEHCDGCGRRELCPDPIR